MNTKYRFKKIKQESKKKSDRGDGHILTLNSASFKAVFKALIFATAHPSSLLCNIFICAIHIPTKAKRRENRPRNRPYIIRSCELVVVVTEVSLANWVNSLVKPRSLIHHTHSYIYVLSPSTSPPLINYQGVNE